jgi:DNA-binding NarL/FixJ family response regulator
MDIRMPASDGIAAAREIRANYPHVKVIGLSEHVHDYNTCDGTSWSTRGLSKIDGVGRTLYCN